MRVDKVEVLLVHRLIQFRRDTPLDTIRYDTIEEFQVEVLSGSLDFMNE